MMMKQHINKFAPLIVSLINSGRSNPYVLAMLITECYFRNSFHRTLEYLAWILLYKLCPSRELKLSVGLAQVQVRHWINLKFIGSSQPSFSTLQKALNPYVNYDICLAYLEDSLKEGASLGELALIYRGRVGQHHYKVLETAYRYINKLVRARHIV